MSYSVETRPYEKADRNQLNPEIRDTHNFQIAAANAGQAFLQDTLDRPASTAKTPMVAQTEIHAPATQAKADQTTDAQTKKEPTPHDIALSKLYEIAGGDIDKGDVRAGQLTTEQRIAYFKSPEFRNWVASEKAAGHEVFWLKDIDMTQSAGDIFTYFFKWRADNHKFTPEELKVIGDYVKKYEPVTSATQAPYELLNLWETDKVGLLDFWRVYWTSQVGLSKEEKTSEVEQYAPLYASRVYPGVPEENKILTADGVNLVAVSNGDEELAVAGAKTLGVEPENVVGSNLVYGADGKSLGINHSYEIFDQEWQKLPQPGKPLAFHYWLNKNKSRFGWDHIDSRKVVIAGYDGDSAGSDGGMMTMLPFAPAIGNFMINTPGEPNRIQKFYKMQEEYGWSPGQCFTLNQRPSVSSKIP